MCDDPSDPETTEDIEALRQKLHVAIGESYLALFFPKLCAMLQDVIKTVPLSDSYAVGVEASIYFFQDPEKGLEKLEEGIRLVRGFVAKLGEMAALGKALNQPSTPAE